MCEPIIPTDDWTDELTPTPTVGPMPVPTTPAPTFAPTASHLVADDVSIRAAVTLMVVRLPGNENSGSVITGNYQELPW